LKQAAAKHTTAIDRIYSVEMFKDQFGQVMGAENGLSDTDFAVLLTFLRREKNSIFFDGKVLYLLVKADIFQC
jgi:charged multivesicular body protein 7